MPAAVTTEVDFLFFLHLLNCITSS